MSKYITGCTPPIPRAALAGLALLAVTLGSPGVAAAKLDVVATLPDLAAVADAVGGDLVDVTVLAAPNEDPHYVDPRPNLILPLNRADLVVLNGLQLEVGWLPPLLANARNADVQEGADGHFDASEHVRRKEVPTTRVDRSEGDVHPGGNPHYMHSPVQAARVAEALGERMSRLDPEHADRYREQAGAYAETLRDLAREEAARFGKLSDDARKVVVYHRSLVYLLDWLDLERVTTVEPKPGIRPSPGRVAEVLKTMRRTGTHVIVQEEFYPTRLSETLARMAEGDLVLVPGGTRYEDDETYLERIRKTSGRLYDALAN
ncbi:MAG: metal ABC transporter substrate-binding protein [Myxococcota bacterium]